MNRVFLEISPQESQWHFSVGRGDVVVEPDPVEEWIWESGFRGIQTPTDTVKRPQSTPTPPGTPLISSGRLGPQLITKI